MGTETIDPRFDAERTAKNKAAYEDKAAQKKHWDESFGATLKSREELNVEKLVGFVDAFLARHTRGMFIRYQLENGKFSQWYGPKDAIVDAMFYLESRKWEIGTMPKSVWLTPDLALYTNGPCPGNAVEYTRVSK